MQQEVMAWEEAASPVLPPMQEDLTESARMTEPTGGHASADTPVEAMNFEQPAAAEAKPSVAARPITSAAIADMRSIAPSSVARGGQGDKAAVAQAAASAPSAQSPAPAPVSQRTPLPSEIVRSPSKPTYTAPQSSPGLAASASVPSPAKDRPSALGVADFRPSVSFDPGAGLPSALSPSQEADEDATIPQIKLSPTERPAAASSAAAASTGSPTPPDEVDTNLLPKISAPQPAVAAPASAATAADAAPQVEARAEEEASGKTPVESNWFATPAAGASEGFAADDDDVSIRRKGLPKWAIPAAAAGLLVLGLGWFAMRSPTPGPTSTPPTTESAGAAGTTPPTTAPATAPTTPTATAEPVVPKEPAPAAAGTTATGAEVGKPEAPTATPAPQPVATALPGTEKPAPAATPPTVVATNVPKPTVEAMAPVAPKPAEPKPAVEKPVEAPPVKAVAEVAPATQKPTRADKKAGKVAKTEEDPVAAAEPKAAEPKAAGGKNGEAGALISSGRKKLDDGDPDAAVALFAKAAELDPKNVDAVGGLGEASFEAGNLAAAAKHLGKAARLAPRRTSYQELLAQAQLKLGRFSDAVETCNKVLKQNPGSSKAKQTLEVAQKKLGDG